MNFKGEKMDLPLSYLSPEPVDWYANDQATNKALLSQINSKAKLQTETYECYCQFVVVSLLLKFLTTEW